MHGPATQYCSASACVCIAALYNTGGSIGLNSIRLSAFYRQAALVVESGDNQLLVASHLETFRGVLTATPGWHLEEFVACNQKRTWYVTCCAILPYLCRGPCGSRWACSRHARHGLNNHLLPSWEGMKSLRTGCLPSTGHVCAGATAMAAWL